ncbi:MAG: hypothetical protein AABX23_05095 [Nanoarchaeota archaeon]
MKSLVDKIFEKVNRIPTFREDPEMYRKLLEISAGYVMETIKKEGGFFPAFEEALVQREEKTRYPLQHPRFTQKVFIGKNELIKRRGALRIDEILTGKAITNYPGYKGNGSIVIPSSQEKGYVLYNSDRKRLGAFLQKLFDEQQISGRVHLSLKEKYSGVLSPTKNTSFSNPIVFDVLEF